MARQGKSILEIRDYMDKHYYPMNFTLDGIRDSYQFNETCQETVPQALMAFFESTSFEDAIRNAISIGGDSDTLCGYSTRNGNLQCPQLLRQAYHAPPLYICRCVDTRLFNPN